MKKNKEKGVFMAELLFIVPFLFWMFVNLINGALMLYDMHSLNAVLREHTRLAVRDLGAQSTETQAQQKAQLVTNIKENYNNLAGIYTIKSDSDLQISDVTYEVSTGSSLRQEEALQITVTAHKSEELVEGLSLICRDNISTSLIMKLEN